MHGGSCSRRFARTSRLPVSWRGRRGGCAALRAATGPPQLLLLVHDLADPVERLARDRRVKRQRAAPDTCAMGLEDVLLVAVERLRDLRDRLLAIELLRQRSRRTVDPQQQL